ncbi:MAG: alpha-E domain-containing protein [Pseudomonadota bacterium]
MLGKTANGLFWMYRLLERAENNARLIETGQRMALTRSSGDDQEWISILETSGMRQGYEAKHETFQKDLVIDWMLRDLDNPASVRACIEAARQNARMVRTAITHETWEATNGGYMAIKEALTRRVSERDLPNVLGLVRQRTALVRGATHGTMLRNDIYDFARLGTFLERADNTARILDTKYYVLLPTASAVGSRLDNAQWETILRSVSARGGYRMVHGNDTSARDVAQFLMLDRRFPRSLWFCVGKLQDNLGYLAADYGERRAAHDQADALCGKLSSSSIDMIFEEGLHEFIQGVIGSLYALGTQVEKDYRFYD